MSHQPLQPVTGRTGGGRSARLAALAAAGVLIGFIWLGISGRPSEPSSTPSLIGLASPPPPTVLPPASARPAASSRPVITPAPVPTPVAAPSAEPGSLGPLNVNPFPLVPLGEDAFAVTVWLRERFYMAVLREEERGQLSAIMRLPLFDQMPTTKLQLIQLWTREDRAPLAEVATYDVRLGRLLGDRPTAVLLEVTHEPRSRGRRQLPRLVREGYTLRISTDVRMDHAYLLFNVAIGDRELTDTATERLLRMTRGWRDLGQRRDTVNLWSCTSNVPLWYPRHDC